MANHARGEQRGVGDKRAALAGAQRNAYVHSEQVGGTKRREADGRWVDRAEAAPSAHGRGGRPTGDSRSSEGFLKRNIVYVLSVVAVVVIALLLVFGVRMFADLSAPFEEDGYVSPYDWSNLEDANGRLAYVVDGQVKSRLGVDVAEYDQDVDWASVAADGIDFAMVRLGYRGATEGALYEDECYRQNIDGAKAAGLDCGVYFFSQAISVEEAREEADFVLSALNGAKLEYPVAYDFENVRGVGQTRTAGLSDEELSDIADAFCDRIEQAGYRTLVYGNAYDLDSYNVDVLTGRDVWWAEYGAEYPSHDLDIVMWQYASDGSVDGISTGVDMNIDLSGALS